LFVAPSLERFRRLLCALQDAIRDDLMAAQKRQKRRFAGVAAVTAADTIYHVDKISEETISRWFRAHWPATAPVEVVMEGIEGEAALTFPTGTRVATTQWKCIIDPIDGTRGYMYDKRPAWSLAGLAPQRGPKTKLGDIVVAAMTELPTSKQWRADQFSVVCGAGRSGVIAHSVDVRRGTRARLTFRPSVAKDFRHGFSSLARFFPEGKALISRIEEELWTELHGRTTSPLVFDDQYISTGGQLAEILVGHDRMVGDIRPAVYAKLKLGTALCCHPYDICTALIASEAGIIVEDPLGGALKAPLDTTTPVAWVAYANPHLAKLARPVLRRLIRRYL
jgi:fructose-1,6-bisphosphatase/inositol monophosphatase family enzyme